MPDKDNGDASGKIKYRSRLTFESHTHRRSTGTQQSTFTPPNRGKREAEKWIIVPENVPPRKTFAPTGRPTKIWERSNTRLRSKKKGGRQQRKSPDTLLQNGTKTK